MARTKLIGNTRVSQKFGAKNKIQISFFTTDDLRDVLATWLLKLTPQDLMTLHSPLEDDLEDDFAQL